MDRTAEYTCLQATFDFDLSFTPRFSIKSALSLKKLMSGKSLLCLWWTFIIQFTLMEIYSFRSVTCNRCNVFSPHKCWTYTNKTFCTLSFNRKLIKFCSGNNSKLRGPFCLIFAWTPWILNSRHTSAQASHGQSTHLR